MGRAPNRHAVTITGDNVAPVVLLHGFGTDQTIWDGLLAQFEPSTATLRYDHMGSGRSQLEGYDPHRYATLQGYADDLVEILTTLDVRDATIIGHSVSGMISLLAAERTERITRLVMIASSPRYLNAPGYVGGFEVDDVESLLAQMELDFLGWARSLGPAAMANPERPHLGEALVYSFSRANPELLRGFARATFFTDLRERLPHCDKPVLVLQPSEDVIVPHQAAAYLAHQLPRGRLQILSATGHYPHVSAPAEVAAAIDAFRSDGRG